MAAESDPEPRRFAGGPASRPAGSSPARGARDARVFLAFAAVVLLLHLPALRGPFVSDDFKDIANNPYLAAISVQNIADIASPWGHARLFTANYAPVHLFAHMLERLLFGNDMLGYHVVNCLVHALNATLLVALLASSGVPGAAALAGGAFFAVHPATVEAVAWISQLKTAGALAFSLGALLLFGRRPGLATLLYALGLLTKTSALAALPMAAAFAFARRADRRAWTWLGAWIVVSGLYAIPQLTAYQQMASFEAPGLEDPAVHLRTIAAIGARYLAMAASSWGIAAFQEPAPATSPLEPWWLASLPLGALLLARTLATLRARREEAAWWIGAAAGFAPISQIFPFVYPIADRYLYFVLPGLIGGTLLAGADLVGRLERSPRGRRARAALRRAAPVALAALLLVFAARSAQRATLWRDEALLLADAAAHYPQGGTARYLAACRAGKAGDVAGAVAELRAERGAGAGRFMGLEGDPCFAAIRDDPAFREYLRESAGRWLEEAYRREVHTQAALRSMAHAHLLRGEFGRARRLLRRALEVGGPQDGRVRRELQPLRERRREKLRARERAATAEPGARSR